MRLVAGHAEGCACGRLDAPGHARGVVGEADATVGAEEDDASVTAQAFVEIGNGLCGGVFGSDACGDAVDGPLAEDELHDGLAPAGERDGGGVVVGVATAADERGVADPAGGFGERTSGAGGGGDVAVDVEGDGTDGVMGFEGGCGFFVERRFGSRAGEGLVDAACEFGLLEGVEAGLFAGDDEVHVLAELHAVLAGEALGSGAHEVDVRAFVEDEAGSADGVTEAFDAGDAAGAKIGAVHEEGVELDAAIAGEEAAATGVEGVVIFHDDDGGFDSGDGGATGLEDSVSGGEGVGDTVLVGGDRVVGHGPCSAMDDEGGARVRHLG